jgi:hypothetical protein
MFSNINENLLSKIDNNINEDMINVIMRQTTLTREEIIKELVNNNFNYLQVISNFIGIKNNKSIKNLTINQQIYKEIRNTMNTQNN